MYCQYLLWDNILAVTRLLEELVDWCRESDWRGLFIYRGSVDKFNSILEEAGLNNTLCIVTDHLFRPSFCSHVVNYSGVRRLMGREYDNVVFYLEGARFWPGNLIACSIEFVSRGGLYAIQIPSVLDTLFTKYFISVGRRLENALIADNDRVLHYSIYREEPRLPQKPILEHTGDRVLDKLLALTPTIGQYNALRNYPRFINAPYKLYFIHGDRGRGKSSVLGLIIAYTMVSKKGDYVVTAHSIESIQSLYKMVTKALEKLGFASLCLVIGSSPFPPLWGGVHHRPERWHILFVFIVAL